MLAILVGALWLAGLAYKNLDPDFRIAANPVPTEGQVDGKCTTHQAVLTDCEVRMYYEADGQSYEVKREFFWFSLGGGDYNVAIVRSAAQPQLATLDIAIDRLWNRVIFAVVILGLMIVIAVMGVRQWRKGRRLRAQYAPDKAQVLRLVAVDVKGAKNRHYGYTLHNDGQKRKFNTHFTPKEAGALLIAPGRALAVVALDAPDMPVLLDANVQRLDLSEQERSTLLQAAAA